MMSPVERMRARSNCVIWCCFLLLQSLSSVSQPVQNSSEFEKQYAERIKMEYIFNVYIPKNLEEVFSELNRLTDTEARQKLKLADENLIASKLHFSLGRWMQIHWGFDEGSRLSHHYRMKGITYTDDLIDLLIRAWHRHLRGVDIREDALIQNYIERRRRAFKLRTDTSEVLKIEEVKEPR